MVPGSISHHGMWLGGGAPLAAAPATAASDRPTNTPPVTTGISSGTGRPNPEAMMTPQTPTHFHKAAPSIMVRSPRLVNPHKVQ